MMGKTRHGVTKQISTDEPRAVYTHCYGHVPNLSVNDCIKQCKLAMETVGERSLS